jgi:hypothetical protein
MDTTPFILRLVTSWKRSTSRSVRLNPGERSPVYIEFPRLVDHRTGLNVKIHIGTEPRPPIPYQVSSLTELQGRLRNSATLTKNWLLFQFHVTLFRDFTRTGYSEAYCHQVTDPKFSGSEHLHKPDWSDNSCCRAGYRSSPI